MKKYQMLIGGAWADPASGEWLESLNPFTAAPWAMIPRGSKNDVDRAVEAARKTFYGDWRKVTASARGALLHKLGELIAADAERLGQIESTDNGKLIAEMRGQLNYIPQWFYYFGGLADKIEGRVIPIDKPGVFNYTREEPLGVVAAITPWNSPLLLAAWKLAPALAAWQNTIVWKPSEHSSVSALELGALFEKAGFPPGVVNIVTGLGSETGEHLITHPAVAKVAFTGGDKTGQHVYELAARGIKHVTLELGGKSANIVFDDADMEGAVKGVVSGIFAATGQTCIAGSRALIQRSIHDEFVERLLALAKTARMGNPLETTTQVGPITTRPQFGKGPRTIFVSLRKRARFAVSAARRPNGPNAARAGLWSPPFSPASIRECVSPIEEVFGPVLSVIPFDDEDEAVQIANSTIYGLAAGVWTTSIRRALSMPDRAGSRYGLGGTPTVR